MYYYIPEVTVHLHNCSKSMQLVLQRSSFLMVCCFAGFSRDIFKKVFIGASIDSYGFTILQLLVVNML